MKRTAGCSEAISCEDGVHRPGHFAIGFGFEVVGDYQLEGLRAEPSNRGKVLDRGLWRFTRHPNYFGDATLWWGVYAMAFEGR